MHIECHGENEHHKIEAIFKAFAKAIRMAVKRDPLQQLFAEHQGGVVGWLVGRGICSVWGTEGVL